MDSEKNSHQQALALLELLTSETDSWSEAAKIRGLIEQIELALSSGASRKSVYNSLKKSLGIKMKFETFETTLYRIRKKRRQKNINYPISTITNNFSNELVPYSNNKTMETSLMPISEISEINKNISNKDNKRKELTELEFRKKVSEPPNISEIEEMGRKYKEKKRKERELMRKERE
ncbi:MAG: hypothetical protein Q8S52_05720 [Methylobacter sp.]|nr:hypothetical protein [Methylobacter sp.]MDP2429434.1 hypothetical protein [Methylobacter sp.]MDP3053941.1 hypothetical protein [Methylobacter sp.]MDP3361607.1 hypothetical protein [Methylobacter sp.]